MFQDYEVYQIYEHIASMCGNPDPSEGCRLVISFCVNEMKKIADIAYQQAHSPDAKGCAEIDYERIMREWDYMRKRIADGDKGSGPRDWFESILEEVTQQAVKADANKCSGGDNV